MAIFSDMDRYSYVPRPGFERPFLRPQRTLDFKAIIDTRDGQRLMLNSDQVFNYTVDQSIPASAELVGSANAATYKIDFDNSGHKITPSNLNNARVRAWIGVEVEYARVAGLNYSEPRVLSVEATNSPTYSSSDTTVDINLKIVTEPAAKYLYVYTAGGKYLHKIYAAATYSTLVRSGSGASTLSDDDDTTELVFSELDDINAAELYDDTGDVRVWTITCDYKTSYLPSSSAPASIVVHAGLKSSQVVGAPKSKPVRKLVACTLQ